MDQVETSSSTILRAFRIKMIPCFINMENNYILVLIKLMFMLKIHWNYVNGNLAFSLTVCSSYIIILKIKIFA